ncbi:hypothetical protein Bca4012_099626 [Brassica carinata]
MMHITGVFGESKLNKESWNFTVNTKMENVSTMVQCLRDTTLTLVYTQPNKCRTFRTVGLVEANTIVVLLCDFAEWRQVLSGNLCFFCL